jgi:hypothetical protein
VVVGAGFVAHPPDEAPALVAPAVGKNQQELVAADAAADVVGTQAVAQKAGHPPERLVARRVTAPVVDPFHVVDIGEQHRESVPGHGPGAAHLFCEALVRVAAVPESRERVLVRDPPERLLLRQLPPQPGVRLAQPRQLSIGIAPSVDHRSPPLTRLPID